MISQGMEDWYDEMHFTKYSSADDAITTDPRVLKYKQEYAGFLASFLP